MKTVSDFKFLILVFFITSHLNIKAQESVITEKDLPKNAKIFIKDYFHEEEILRISKEPKFSFYTVTFNNGKKIEFNKKGEWYEVDGNFNVIPYGFIPKQIVSYIKSKFPSSHIKKIDKDAIQYNTKLSNGLILNFNKEGNFMRIK